MSVHWRHWGSFKNHQCPNSGPRNSYLTGQDCVVNIRIVSASEEQLRLLNTVAGAWAFPADTPALPSNVCLLFPGWFPGYNSCHGSCNPCSFCPCDKPHAIPGTSSQELLESRSALPGMSCNSVLFFPACFFFLSSFAPYLFDFPKNLHYFWVYMWQTQGMIIDIILQTNIL